jgi:hypothetical protein
MKWIKFTEQFPPVGGGIDILIAMKNKNMECGVWLYDICSYFGGDYTDNDNWDDRKINYEVPVYWCLIENPKN